MNQNIFQILSDMIGSIKNLFSMIAFFYQKAIELIPFLNYILIFVVCIILFKIILDKVTKFSNSYFENINSFSLTTYRVLIPNNKKENDEDNKKDLKQVLASLELFFYNIAGIEPEYSKNNLSNILKRYFKGRSDHFSMEIVNDEEDLITFFFSVPKSLDNMITQQIIAVWPDAFIEKVVDYDIFEKNNNTIATSATLLKHYAFPLKTYQNFETDPLDILLNSISKFTKGDGVMIQILARSAYPSWRNYGKKIVSLLNSGRTIEQALASVNKKGFFKKFMNFLSYANGNYDKAKEDFTHKLTPAEEEVMKSIETKSSKPGMDVNLRILVSTNEKDKNKIKDKIRNVTDSFSQYGHFGLLNNFKFSNIKPKKQRKLINKIVYRKFDENASFVLSSDELITLFHFPLETTDVPNVRWLLSRSAPAIFTCPEDGTIVGINTYGGTKKTIKISIEDRLKHMYVIGKSGTGKTSIMKDMAIQDIANGYGVAIIDPHGDFADAVLSYVPKERAHDVVFFDPSDLTRPFGLNLFEYDRNFPEQKTLIINQFIEMLYTMYDQEQIGGPMFEYYTKNALALNMEDPESGNTMIEISRVMADKEFRHMKLEKCADPIIKNFWLKEAEKAGGEAALENIVPYITSKLNQFIQNEFMRNVVGQQNSTINFSDIMNTKKILICKFAKGEIGDMNAQLLGLIVVGRLLISALERTKIPEKDRLPFFLYIDECQNFLTPAVTTILAEARKYGLGLILANQFINQLVKGTDTKVKDGIFGNAGTIVAFRISTEDAEFMEKQMSPVFSRFDLENSPSFFSCAKTLMNNSSTKPFTLQARKYWEIYGDPYSEENVEKVQYIKELSRLKYGKPKEIIEKDILSRLGVLGSGLKEKLTPEQELKKLFGEE